MKQPHHSLRGCQQNFKKKAKKATKTSRTVGFIRKAFQTQMLKYENVNKHRMKRNRISTRI